MTRRLLNELLAAIGLWADRWHDAIGWLLDVAWAVAG